MKYNHGPTSECTGGSAQRRTHVDAAHPAREGTCAVGRDSRVTARIVLLVKTDYPIIRATHFQIHFNPLYIVGVHILHGYRGCYARGIVGE